MISFEYDGSEISAMVEDGLSNTSTLEAATKEGDVASEFNLVEIELGAGEQLSTLINRDISVDYKFRIKRSNGLFTTF